MGLTNLEFKLHMEKLNMRTHINAFASKAISVVDLLAAKREADRCGLLLTSVCLKTSIRIWLKQLQSAVGSCSSQNHQINLMPSSLCAKNALNNLQTTKELERKKKKVECAPLSGTKKSSWIFVIFLVSFSYIYSSPINTDSHFFFSLSPIRFSFVIYHYFAAAAVASCC